MKDNIVSPKSSGETKQEPDTSYLNVKQFRHLKHMSLRELARESGLTLSYLSNYENGKVNITINSLKRISNALGIPVAELLGGTQDNDIIVVPKDARVVRELYVAPSGVALQEYLMSSGRAAMHVLIGRLPPHSDSGEPSAHYGEEFILSIQGVVSVILDNATYQLKEGDMIYYRSTHLHKVANEQDSEIVYLHVNTPPTF